MTSNKRKFIKKLKNKYRLVVINDNNFADVFSIRLTPLNVLMLFSSILVIITLFIFLLIARTPLRELVPGYGKGSDNTNLIQLKEELDDLHEKEREDVLRADALRKILSGQENLLDSFKK